MGGGMGVGLGIRVPNRLSGGGGGVLGPWWTRTLLPGRCLGARQPVTLLTSLASRLKVGLQLDYVFRSLFVRFLRRGRVWASRLRTTFLTLCRTGLLLSGGGALGGVARGVAVGGLLVTGTLNGAARVMVFFSESVSVVGIVGMK